MRTMPDRSTFGSYKFQTSKQQSLSGLVVDSQNPCLACSPDGLVSIPGTPEPEGLMEIKWPYIAAEKQITPQQAAESSKEVPCKLISRDAGSGKAVLEFSWTEHNYFFQVKGQIAITERSWCDYVTWTPRGMSVEGSSSGRGQTKSCKVSSLDDPFGVGSPRIH